MKRNPKQVGTNLFDCIPQVGPCPKNCNQCYYNRPGASCDRPHFPSLGEVGNGIVRVNSGHDSNINRDYVIAYTEHYPRRFFNTSIPNFDFPAPVVYTANPSEENPGVLPIGLKRTDLDNIMFVRLRVSSTNLLHVLHAARKWSQAGVPVVLTFMHYYENPPDTKNYEFRKHIKNDCWCPTRSFIAAVFIIAWYLATRGEITMCGTFESSFCRDCGNCERFYHQRK